MEGVIDRCPTGIKGFDLMCEGGFVRNSDNLLVGGPGTGKTTFLLQFLWNGITQFNENGLYCSFEPDIVDTLNDGLIHGWNFSRLSEDGRIKFIRFSPETKINDLKKELQKIISRDDVRRVCFDPITVLALNLSEEGDIRQKIFEISSLMKRLKVTTIFADESFETNVIGTPLTGEWTKTDILRFLSDSVTILYDTKLAKDGDRALRIAKMRRTEHVRKLVGMKLVDEGMEVLYKKEEANKEKTIPKKEVKSPPVLEGRIMS